MRPINWANQFDWRCIDETFFFCADLFEIVPTDTYSSDDLNYNDDNCRVNQEQNDRASRPEISYDFSGKTMVDFCTSGGSGISTSESNLKELCSAEVNRLTANKFAGNADVETVREWVENLGVEIKNN